jgi:hypothetical protein
MKGSKIMIIRNKNWKTTWRTTIAALLVLLFWTVLFSIWINAAQACQPNDPTCTCESDSSAEANSSAVAGAIGIGYSTAEIIEGDTILSSGDNVFNAGDTQLSQGDMNNASESKSSVGEISALGGTSHTGDNNISMESIYDPGIMMPEIAPSEIQIGSTRKPVAAIGPFVGVSNSNYRHRTSWIAGISAHIPLYDKKVPDIALQRESDKIDMEKTYLETQNTYLTDKNARLQAKHDEEMKIMEREHQARFVKLCTSTHLTHEKREGSNLFDELWNFCYGIEHINNRTTNDIVGRHNQEIDGKPNPNQFMPHSKAYHDDVPVMIDAEMKTKD